MPPCGWTGPSEGSTSLTLPVMIVIQQLYQVKISRYTGFVLKHSYSHSIMFSIIISHIMSLLRVELTVMLILVLSGKL